MNSSGTGANEDVEELDQFPDAMTRDFAMAMDAAWLKTKEGTFEDIEQAYRQVETAFIERAAENEVYQLEMRRAIAESIFKAAVNNEQSFEGCTSLWNEVLRLGFSDIETTCTITWYYAECCRRHKQTTIGLRVLEPIIAELQRLLTEPPLQSNTHGFCRKQLGFMHKLLAKLNTQGE